jgi:succinate-acetate transporter protein
MSDVEKLENGHRHRTRLGNPGPLGLFAFASTTLVLSLYNAHARHITTPNVVVGMALFYGGLAQFLAGMWEFATGNTFGATAFTSYGAFWLSFATIFIPNSGIGDAYAAAPAGQEDDALGIYLLAWMIVTFLFFIGSLRKSIGLSALFFFLTLTFMVLAISFLMKKENLAKAGGYLGVITALIAYYCGLAELLTTDDIFTIPLGKYRTD